MQGLRWVQMSDDEMNEFLGRGGTGVLAFSTEAGEPPFQLPIAYGYNPDLPSFYFRLAFLPNSKKAAVIENPLSFATQTQTDRGWRSVVASGYLEEVTEMPYESNAVQGMWAIQIPYVDIFDRPEEEITFRDFRLVPEKMTDRKEVHAQP